MRAAAIQDLEGLKHYLKKAAPHRPHPIDGLETGLGPLDQLIGGGFPKGALTVVTGLSGSGRMSLAAAVLAKETKRKHAVAWIDAKGTLYPPALDRFGVHLAHVLMVRPPEGRAMYAMQQIAESGAFSAIAASGIDRALAPAALRRLQSAAEAQKSCIVLVLDPKSSSSVSEAALRLRVTRQTAGLIVEVEKNRFAALGRMFVDLGTEAAQCGSLTESAQVTVLHV